MGRSGFAGGGGWSRDFGTAQADAPGGNFQKPALTHASHDEELPEEEEEIRAIPPQTSPDDVPHQQEERVPGRGAEVGAVNGDLGWEEKGWRREKRGCTEPTTRGRVQIPPWKRFLTHCRPVVQVLQGDPDDLDNSQHQRAEGQRAGVRAAEGGEEREGRHVVGLLEGPVVGGEGPRQRHLAQGDDEVGQPEEHEDVEELQHDEVLVVGGLAAVEGEQALGVGAHLGDVGGVEGLGGTRGTALGQPGVTAGV
uniref:Uncharacterized protein n=1 Tax=Cyanoderma ruficeps TaxID=181631 RepID=A0A8C3XDZ1_9PASS